MVWEAVRDGATSGFVEGATTLAIDTVINVATSRVPYLQGAVELVRLVRDPKKYLTGFATDKLAPGIGQLFGASSSPVDRIEGLLNIVDGINGLLSLISSICWIVAGAGLIASLFFPAILPFVGMAAQWGMTIGKVSTVVGMFITAFRPIVILLRSLELLASDASPEELKKKQDALRSQVLSFSSEFTTRAGHTLRSRAQQGLNNRAQRRAGQTPAAPTPPQGPSRASGNRVVRIVGLLSGAGGRQALSNWDDQAKGREQLRSARQSMRQTRGQATADRLAGLESTGMQVFAGDRHRQRVNRQLAAQEQRQQGQTGQTDQAPTGDRVQDLEQAQQRYDAARQRADQAAAERQATRQQLTQRQQELQAAQQALRDARAQQRPAIAAAEQELRARQQLRDEYHRDSQRADAQVESQRNVVSQLRTLAQQDPQSGNTGPYRQRLQAAEAELARLQQNASAARRTARDADDYLREGQQQVDQARQPVRDAREQVRGAQSQADRAHNRDARAATTEQQANQAQAQAQSTLGRYDTATNRDATQNRNDAYEERGSNRWYFDFTGNGPGDRAPYGQNKSAGETGSGVSLLGEEVDRQTGEEKTIPQAVQRGVGSAAQWVGALFRGSQTAPSAPGIPAPAPTPTPAPSVDAGPATPAPTPDAGPAPAPVPEPVPPPPPAPLPEAGPDGPDTQPTPSATPGASPDGGPAAAEPAGAESQRPTAPAGPDPRQALRGKLNALSAALPAPPRETVQQMAQAQSRIQALVQQRDELHERSASAAQLREEGHAQVQVLGEVQGGVTQMQGQVQQHGAEIAGKQQHQQQLQAKTGQASGQAQGAQAKGQETQGLVGSFLGGFMQLMGMVPTRILGNAGEGAAAGPRVQQGVQSQAEVGTLGAQGSQQAAQTAARFSLETQALGGQQQELSGQVQGVGAQAQARQAEAQQGVAQLQQAQQQAQQGAAQSEAQLQQAQAQYNQAHQRQDQWAQQHLGVRGPAMAEIETLAASIEGGAAEGATNGGGE
ncbi:MAG: hypothetical protein U1A78_15620 [Polyangia bacterium]